MVQEAKLREFNQCMCRDIILYDVLFNDQYEVFQFEFPIKLYKWLKRLIEAPKNQNWQNKMVHWVAINLAALHRVDHQVSHAVYFQGVNLVEGYIVEFAVENNQSLSKEEATF